MPGKLGQYYSVRWMNDSVIIATSNPHSVVPVCQLHDNFSLTIINTKPSDSSTSYQCSVTVDDPQISGTHDVVYDQSQLGLITVMVHGESPNKYTHSETYLTSFPGHSQILSHSCGGGRPDTNIRASFRKMDGGGGGGGKK